MSIDLYPVLIFLTEHAASEALLPDAWSVVRAVNAFATAPPSEGVLHADAESLRSAVENVTRRAIDRVTVLPRECGMPNESFMRPEAFMSPFRSAIAVPEERLDRETAKALYAVVHDAFGDILTVSLGARLADTPWAGFAAALAEDLVDALFGFLANVVVDDAVAALRYQHYLDNAMRTLIVGEVAAKPGVWVAVAA